MKKIVKLSARVIVIPIVAAILIIFIMVAKPCIDSETIDETNHGACIQMANGKTFCEVGTVSVESGGIKEMDRAFRET